MPKTGVEELCFAGEGDTSRYFSRFSLFYFCAFVEKSPVGNFPLQSI
jgi:hypothetical protein